METTTEKEIDKVADHLHLYPDFKYDHAKGFFLGEEAGKYYFYTLLGEVTSVENYNVANNIENYFRGALIAMNKIGNVPPKTLTDIFHKEAYSEESKCQFATVTDRLVSQPFMAEILCMDIITKTEKTLPLREDINGWNHLLIVLERLVAENNDEDIISFEGIDHYFFTGIGTITHKLEGNNFRYVVTPSKLGFKIKKKALLAFIKANKFSK